MKKTLYCLLLCGFVMGLVLGGQPRMVTGAPKSKGKTISWGTFRMGSSSYAQAAGAADVIQRHTNISVTVEPVGGPVAQIKMMVEKRQTELGYTDSYNLAHAYLGTGSFAKHGGQPIRLLAAAHALKFGIIVRSGLGVKTFSDLKGKVISCVWPVAPLAEDLTRALLGAHGVSPGEVKLSDYSGSAKESRNLIEGRIDAFFASLGGPKMHDLERAGAYVVPVSSDPKVAGFVKSRIPGIFPATYKDKEPAAKGDTPCFAVPESFYTWEGLDEGTAYDIVKAIMENPKELAKTSRDLSEWNLENFAKIVIMPFHRGAIKYYKEKGVWTRALEARQKELLAKGKR